MTFFIIIQLDLEWDENTFDSNQMEDQIGAVLHWSHQKEPKQPKSKDEAIRRNPNIICISAATPRPSNPSTHSQMSLIKNKIK